jgi:hypothetical protein
VTSGRVFLVTLASTIGGSVLGAVLRRCLPARHLGADNKEVIRLGVSLLATLSAVAISLMIASAKSSYDIQDAHFRQFSADVILTDQLLAQYGPEAAGIRQLIRQAFRRRWIAFGPRRRSGRRKPTRLPRAPPPSRFTMRSRRCRRPAMRNDCSSRASSRRAVTSRGRAC